MANILFLTDVDPGHIFPSLRFAKSLESEGHNIAFSGIPDIKITVNQFGFKFMPIFEDIYPEGFINNYKQFQKENPDYLVKELPRPHLNSIINGDLDNVIKDFAPALLIANSVLSIESCLILKKYKLKMLFFTSWLRKKDTYPAAMCKYIYENLDETSKKNITNFLKAQNSDNNEVFERLNEVPELIPCSSAFELPGIDYETEVRYIETGLEFSKSDFTGTLGIASNKKILYVALGTQTAIYPGIKAFYQSVIEMFSLPPFNHEWHLIMVVSKENQSDLINYRQSNISILDWVPQTDVLKESAIAIIHGGLGSVKECILSKTPMVIIPFAHDQFDNANRVVFHKLGKCLTLEQATPSFLAESVDSVYNDGEIVESIKKMHRDFSSIEKQKPGLIFIENLINTP